MLAREEHGTNAFVQQIGLQQHHHAVTCLGGALGGELAFQLGGQVADVPAPTVKRIEKAKLFADAIDKLLVTETTLPRLRAAWCLLQSVLNRALDFDVRVLHPAAIGQIAIEFDRRVEETAARILGERDSSGCHQRLRIHTLHGGGGLTSYSDKSACGYLVAVREVAVGVAQRLGAQGHAPEAVTSTLAQRVIPGCIACEQALANRGVQLLIGGGIGRTSGHRASVEEWLRAGPAANQG